MRVVFMGTPAFAVPSLEALARRHEVALVVTRPDAVRSRGRKVVPSPVAEAAERLGLPVERASRIDAGLASRIDALASDVCCVAAYGCLVPDDVLAMPRLGCVNVHASLLPRWRGAAPIQRAMLAGDARVGVSIMRVVHDLDAGPWCRQASVEVGEATCAEVTAELARLGAEELLRALDLMERGEADWAEQDEALVTYARKVDKAEFLLDPADPARDNLLRVQASLDASPARLELAGRGLRAMRARAADAELAPGEACADRGRVLLGCADGAIELVSVKPDGKREMSASAFAAGLRDAAPSWGRVG